MRTKRLFHKTVFSCSRKIFLDLDYLWKYIVRGIYVRNVYARYKQNMVNKRYSSYTNLSVCHVQGLVKYIAKVLEDF